MKISLKSTILFICFSIMVVIAYQFYWLNNLYARSKKELHLNIQNAMKTADISELQLRIKELESNPDKSGTITASAGFSSDKALKTETQTEMSVKNDTGEVHMKDNSTFKDTTQQMDETNINQELVASMFMKGLHQAVDKVAPPNVIHYDSLLTIELTGYNIEKKHYVDLIDVKTDSVIYTSKKTDENLSKSNIKQFEYVFGMDDEFKYQLMIENPNLQVLQQMTGILVASGIVLLLLAWLFYYLLHTIWRQKTLEEMKNDFINNMTHELKTPLSVSYAAVDSLLVTEKANDKEHRDRYLNIAKDQINHLTGLVEQILSMSKENKNNVEMNPESIQLEEMIQSIVDQQQLATKKTVRFEICIEPKEATVYFDRIHLANILNNLIENSIKYSNESVFIKIQACYNSKRNIQISIEDNGIGIDSEKQKNVFDKFYRVPTGNKQNVKGYGLGLFYVKEILEKGKGSISLKSRLGKGSIFTIQIPQQ